MVCGKGRGPVQYVWYSAYERPNCLAPGAGTCQSPPQVPNGGTIAVKAGARVKCETPAAEKMRPRGTGHVKSRQVANHPSGRSPSSPESNITAAAVPAATTPTITPTAFCCSMSAFDETRTAGSGRGTPAGPGCSA